MYLRVFQAEFQRNASVDPVVRLEALLTSGRRDRCSSADLEGSEGQRTLDWFDQSLVCERRLDEMEPRVFADGMSLFRSMLQDGIDDLVQQVEQSAPERIERTDGPDLVPVEKNPRRLVTVFGSFVLAVRATSCVSCRRSNTRRWISDWNCPRGNSHICACPACFVLGGESPLQTMTGGTVSRRQLRDRLVSWGRSRLAKLRPEEYELHLRLLRPGESAQHDEARYLSGRRRGGHLRLATPHPAH